MHAAFYNVPVTARAPTRIVRPCSASPRLHRATLSLQRAGDVGWIISKFVPCDPSLVRASQAPNSESERTLPHLPTRVCVMEARRVARRYVV